MKLGVLFSGGKDSTYALHIAQQYADVVCLITIKSKNKESYMFHTPAIDATILQAQALGLPIISIETDGVKESELDDLKKAICKAKKEFKLDGVVNGAVESIYQASRIERIADELNLWCFSPLWKKEQEELLSELVQLGFHIIITGVFAEPLGQDMLGKKLDNQLITELLKLRKSHGISPSGEGGEIETLVVNAPNFKQKLTVEKLEKMWDGNSGCVKVELRLEK